MKGSCSSQTAGVSHSFRQAWKFAKLQVCRSEDREQDPTQLSVRQKSEPVFWHHQVNCLARQALGGAALVPEDEVTFAALRDRQRRPPELREPIRHEIFEHRPEHQFALDNDWFLHNVQASMKGAAAGPSGMTSERIFPPLRNRRDRRVVVSVGHRSCAGRTPS